MTFLILILVVFPGSFKVLVVTGQTLTGPMGSSNPEIIDLEKPTAVCSQPSDLPAIFMAAIGGVIDGSSLFVCFGTVPYAVFIF